MTVTDTQFKCYGMVYFAGTRSIVMFFFIPHRIFFFFYSGRTIFPSILSKVKNSFYDDKHQPQDLSYYNFPSILNEFKLFQFSHEYELFQKGISISQYRIA